MKLIQQHTIDLYDLKSKKHTKKSIPARQLLTLDRFDLFAKLAYIKYRKSQPEKALEIYEDHIKAFNPDLKEPGRNDKNSVGDFVNTFNELIDYFAKNEFDATKSLVPVSSGGTILDGSHRVAALAYFDKKIDILQFEDIKPVTNFDHAYFIKRGLSPRIADQIAFEALDFIPNMYMACLWPRMGKIKNREFALNYIDTHFNLFYAKNIRMPLENMSHFIYEIYKHQNWVGNAENDYQGARNKAAQCYAANGVVQFAWFYADSLNKVIKAKEEIRKHYQLEKHALHISDDQKETIDMSSLTLTAEAKQFSSAASAFKDKIEAYKNLFKNVYWINFKVKIAHALKKIGIKS